MLVYFAASLCCLFALMAQLVLVVPTSIAQSIFQYAQGPLPIPFGQAYAVARINNDAYPDFIGAGASGIPPGVYLGTASGKFIETPQGVGGVNCNDLLAVDVNNDNLSEFICIAASASTNNWEINLIPNIGGMLGAPVLIDSLTTEPELQILDFDSNGSQDVVGITDGGQSISVFFGSGASTFIRRKILSTSNRELPFYKIVIGDVDNNLINDVLATHIDGKVVLYSNPGSASSGKQFIGSQLFGALIPVLADIDNDLDLDIVLAPSTASQNINFIRNDAPGIWSTVGTGIALGNNYVSDIKSSDLNLDGKLDLVVAKDLGGLDIYLQNAVPFTFSNATATFLPRHANNRANKIKMVDFDSDRAPDVMALNKESFIYHGTILGNARGTLLRSVSHSRTVSMDSRQAITEDFCVGNFNNDRYVDMVIPYGAAHRVYLGDGTGHLSSFNQISGTPNALFTKSCSSADLDRDGIDDLILAVGNGALYDQVRYGDINGSFANSGPILPRRSTYTLDSAVADFNGDGLTDIVFAGIVDRSVTTYSNRVIINGIVNFSEIVLTSSDATWTTVAVADVEGDGDIDIFLGNDGLGFGSTSELHLNQGNGNFILVPAPIANNADISDATFITNSFSGTKDLFITRTSAPNEYYINSAGIFMQTPFTDTFYGNSVTAGDVDGDGLEDLVVGDDSLRYGRNVEVLRLYLNTGSSNFVRAILPTTFASYISKVKLRDLDSDSDLDLLTVEELTPTMYHNRRTHIDFGSRALRGRPLAVELGSSTPGATATLYGSFGPLMPAIATPFGSLRLGSLIPIGTFLINPSTVLSVPIPFGAGIREFSMQALIVSGSSVSLSTPQSVLVD